MAKAELEFPGLTGALKLPEGMELADDSVVIPQGNLNRMVPVHYKSRLYLLRLPRTIEEVTPTHEALAIEYEGLGFTALGGGYRFRTLTEQVEFVQRCQALGLGVGRLERWDGLTIARYEPGIRLSHYNRMAEADAGVTLHFLDTVVLAHREGVVLGDRWTPNALVTPVGDVVHVDFDINLSGPVAREFELSQAIYYGSQSANPAVGKAVASWLQDMSRFGGYNWDVVEYFLKAHQKYGEAHPDMSPYPVIITGD